MPPVIATKLPPTASGHNLTMIGSNRVCGQFIANLSTKLTGKEIMMYLASLM